MAAALIVLASPSVAGASGWSKPARYGPIEQGASLSCATESFCMAVAHETPVAVIYKDGKWSKPEEPIKGIGFTSVSCPTESFCVALTPTGGVIYKDGSWGTPFTIDTEANGADLDSVDCTSSEFCVAVALVKGKVFTYKGSSWTGPVHVPGEKQLDAVSCATPSFCMAGDEEGDIAEYKAGSWGTPMLVASGEQITSVSCPLETFCAAADSGKRVYTYKAGLWTPTYFEALVTSYSKSVSCSSETFCGAVSFDSRGWTFNGSSWSTPVPVDTAGGPDGVACVSATFCLAIDDGGNYFTYTGPPEFGRCLKQTTKAVSNFDSANCTKLASADIGTEAEKLKKGNYQWTSGVAKAKFATVLKSGTLATLESVRGVKITCTGETSSGEYVRTSELGKLIAKFTGCSRGSEKCSSAGRGVGEIETHPLGGALGFESEVKPPSKDHIADELHSESGNIMEFSCGGVPVVVRGSLLHKIAANAMKLTATEKFTASKGKQKPEHFAGGAAKEHTLEMSTNGEAFEQAGWALTEILTNEEKVEASTIN